MEYIVGSVRTLLGCRRRGRCVCWVAVINVIEAKTNRTERTINFQSRAPGIGVGLGQGVVRVRVRTYGIGDGKNIHKDGDYIEDH